MVHVIQGKDLPGIDINPYVGVQIDDQERYTKVNKLSNSPYFGEVSHLKKTSQIINIKSSFFFYSFLHLISNYQL